MPYAPVNGQEIYYEEHGDGPPLVLLHGGLLTIDLTFGAVLGDLARTHRVVAVELQGHGHTADIDREFTLDNLASDVVGVLDHLGIDQADFFGFSLGGLVGTQVALRSPEQVGRLVGASVHFRADGYHPDVFAMEAGSRRLPSEQDFADMMSAHAAVAPHPEQFEAFAAKASALPERHEWSGDELRGLRVPVLLIVGDTDFVRVEHAAELLELVPDGRLAVLPDTTHGEVMRRAELVLPMVRGFLQR